MKLQNIFSSYIISYLEQKFQIDNSKFNVFTCSVSP